MFSFRRKSFLSDFATEPEEPGFNEKAEKLLATQREGTFTFRCVDCCHNPQVCIRSHIIPCIMNGEIAEELEIGPKDRHCLLCLLSPLFIGSYLSVGLARKEYRSKNLIPGLASDDFTLACVFPCCVITQLRNHLNEQAAEQAKVQSVRLLVEAPKDQPIARI